MANVLTGIRILCGILILCFPASSGTFLLIYLLGGFTDAIDGTVARKMGEATDFGSKFDTVADFVFAIAVFVKIIGSLHVPLWLFIWIIIIALIKIGSHLTGYFKYHELKTVHSTLNRVCGVVIYIVPLLIGCNFAWQERAFFVIAACVLASVSAIVEALVIHRILLKSERSCRIYNFIN